MFQWDLKQLEREKGEEDYFVLGWGKV